ncbi:MAG: DUF5060 domain-containing protein [Candidatus Sumerlaeota bacterium]|nr:DUF5060 domain-containing protein [Candidatus Sumerlaeota bacterium]
MKTIRFIAAFILGLLPFLRCAQPQAEVAKTASAAALEVKRTQNSRTIPPYEVFEITFQHDQRYANPFFDVTIEVTFTSPKGQEARVGGFHYGSLEKPKIEVHAPPADGKGGKTYKYIFDRQNIWKARFAPREVGRWTYSYVFSNARGEKATGEGSFECVVNPRVHNPGFVRQNPANPFRWIFDDGSPYFPIGLQDGVFDGAGVGSAMAAKGMEGPFRLDRTGRPTPPPGAMFMPGPSMSPINGDIYFRNYGRAGFNLWRFSQKNFSLPLYNDLDHYLVQEAVMVDEMLVCARKYGFHIFYGFFGYQPVFAEHPENTDAMAKVKRFVKYSVDRWGAYVDFWEFLNEQKADARWYEIMTPYLRALDPYQHPIATSWERPELPGIEINAPHWYTGIKNELGSDTETASRAAGWKKFGKPVILGEQGNSTQKGQPQAPGVGGVWDVGSSTRMRIRNWTALFNEIAFVFWNTSGSKDAHYMNIWLGPQERQYVRAMQDFAYRLDKDARMAPVTLSDPKAVRGWALVSKERAGVYLHHYANHTDPAGNLKITLDVPKAAKGYWYAPENAAILQRIDAPAGRQTFQAPSFRVDVALLITPDGPPDIDRDGIPNDLDKDNDNDGVPDVADAFPLDPEEWEDKDGDLIGDNMDADIAANGIGDDKNKNGILDYLEMDYDGDGVPKAKAVPWDAFPLDPKEWRDTDGDGIGDNADADKDGDGWSDEEEKYAGTNPLDKLSFPRQKN